LGIDTFGTETFLRLRPAFGVDNPGTLPLRDSAIPPARPATAAPPASNGVLAFEAIRASPSVVP
jgi:hypothetical protein